MNGVCRRCVGEGVALESTATLIRALAYCDKECNVQSDIFRGIIGVMEQIIINLYNINFSLFQNIN